MWNQENRPVFSFLWSTLFEEINKGLPFLLSSFYPWTVTSLLDSAGLFICFGQWHRSTWKDSEAWVCLPWVLGYYCSWKLRTVWTSSQSQWKGHNMIQLPAFRCQVRTACPIDSREKVYLYILVLMLIYLSNLLVDGMYACGPWCCCRGQRTIWGNWFSPTMWVLGVELRSCGLGAKAFTYWAVLPAPCF